MRAIRITVLLMMIVLLGSALSVQPRSSLLAQQQPILQVSPTSLSFQGQVGGRTPVPQALTISNAGGGLLEWHASTDVEWITLGGTEGKLSGGRSIQSQVFVNTKGLEAGTYQGTIRVEAPGAKGSSVQVTVTLTLTAPTRLDVSPSQLSFEGKEGGSNPSSQALAVTNTGGRSLNWTARANVAWLGLSPSEGTLQVGESIELFVSVNLASISAGTRQAQITISAPGAKNSPVQVSVDLDLQPSGPRTLRVPEDFSTLSAAIAHAQDGDVIEIAPGTYRNVDVTIEKSITIKGATTATQVILQGDKNSKHGVLEVDKVTGEVRIQNLTLSGGVHGILVYFSTKVIIENNVLEGNAEMGVLAASLNGSLLTIRNNIIRNNKHGIAMGGSVSAEISENTITDNAEFGVALLYLAGSPYSGEVRGRGNRISGNREGNLYHAQGEYPWPDGFGGGA